MGVAAYGMKSGENDAEVRYDVMREPDGAVECVLVIDKTDPTTKWRVEGSASTVLGSMVAARALERFRQTGSWPERAAQQS